MKVDSRTLQIKLTRGRTQTMVARVGYLNPNAPQPAGSVTWTWTPIDITNWVFTFTMRQNFTLKCPTIALTYKPIINTADATQGQLVWNILASDTESLLVGNYVFDIAVVLIDGEPRFFCGGTVALADNVSEML